MSTNTPKNIFDRLLKDKQGKIVVWQFPNIPLIGWIVFSLLALFTKQGKLHDALHELAQATLFVWAYLELKMGDSTFRRILGGVVLLSIIIGFFY